MVTVHYVDGSAGSVVPQEWPSLPGEGVDWVEVEDHTGRTRFASHSLYWLYAEPPSIVVGAASLHYDPNPITEVVFTPDAPQRTRTLAFFPDVRLVDVKLGHWWVGTDRPV